MTKNKKQRWTAYALLTAVAAFAVIIFVAPYEDVFEVRSIDLQKAPEKDFLPVQISFLPELFGSVFNTDKPVYGLSVGGMVCQKEIYGISLAGVHAWNDKKSGLSMSFIDACHESQGVSLVAGGGAVTNYGLALGLWNLTENNHGVQIGLVNRATSDALIETPGEEKTAKGFGIQAGVFNESEGKGIQFGLWNVNSRAFFKHMPFFNIAL